MCTIASTFWGEISEVSASNIALYVLLILQALLGNELDKVSQRIDDLCKQIVSSPDKLRNVSLQ